MRLIEVLTAKCQIFSLIGQVSFGNFQATDLNDAGSRRDLSTRGRGSTSRSIDYLLAKCQILTLSDQVSFGNEGGSFA